jgi:hypothetical protein
MNFRIVSIKEIPWMKSTGPWTEGDDTGPWSMVDRASYPLRGSNLGHSMWIQRLRTEEVRAAVRSGPVVAQ